MFKLISSAFIVFALSLPALAHSPLKRTVPANGDTLTDNPPNLLLEFAKPARITKVLLKFTTNGNGNDNGTASEEKLQLPSKQFQTEMLFHPQFSGPGTYEVEWRALGQDGHAMKGSFVFSVLGE